MNATPRPWKVLYKYDTHKVKRDRDGHIIGPVTMDFDDYQHALTCVNTHDKAKAFVRAIAGDYPVNQADWNALQHEAKALLADMEG